MFSPTPDEVIIHPVQRCEHCQRNLTQVSAHGIERRQVVDMPAPLCWLLGTSVQKKAP